MRLRKRMKNKIINWSNKFKIATYMVCLLVTVGILCICVPIKAQASERHLTGDTEVSTVINPAGTATTHEEVGSLNTANTVSITYNNGNGQINGALRILITLTLIALAPTIIIMMTSFTRITSQGLLILLKLFLRMKSTDAICGFTFVRRETALSLIEGCSRDNGWFYMIEFLLRAEKRGVTILDYPVEWQEDYNTTVKVFKTICNYLVQIARLFNEFYIKKHI